LPVGLFVYSLAIVGWTERELIDYTVKRAKKHTENGIQNGLSAFRSTKNIKFRGAKRAVILTSGF
jgi:hypothetical protein